MAHGELGRRVRVRPARAQHVGTDPRRRRDVTGWRDPNFKPAPGATRRPPAGAIPATRHSRAAPRHRDATAGAHRQPGHRDRAAGHQARPDQRPDHHRSGRHPGRPTSRSRPVRPSSSRSPTPPASTTTSTSVPMPSCPRPGQHPAPARRRRHPGLHRGTQTVTWTVPAGGPGLCSSGAPCPATTPPMHGTFIIQP